jgi:hypothetical protein
MKFHSTKNKKWIAVEQFYNFKKIPFFRKDRRKMKTKVKGL